MSGLEVSDDEGQSCTSDILQAIDVDSDGDITMVNICMLTTSSITLYNFRKSL